jgi:hypothetical protein
MTLRRILPVGAAAAVAATLLAGTVSFAATLGVTSKRITLATQVVSSTVTCTVSTSAADTNVDENAPMSNLGAAADLYVRSKSGGNVRTLLRFDLSSCSGLVGGTVSSATLSLYVKGTPPSTRTYGAYRVTSSWAEGTVTWNTQPTVAGSATSTAATTAIGTRTSWNVLADVQAFAGGTANNGWQIRDQAESDAGAVEGKFASKEHGVAAELPRLQIQYATAP